MVVVVESSPVMQRQFEHILRKEGLEAVFFDNTTDALQHLREKGADVVICELKAPPEGGVALCSKMREDPRLRGVGFLISVGITEQFSEEDARMAGANGIIQKPFGAPEVLEAIKKLGAAPKEEVIELTDVVEEPGTQGPEPSEEEVRRIGEVLRESAEELEKVEEPIGSSLRAEGRPSGEGGELEEAVRRIIKVLAEEIARALSDEIRRSIREILREGEK